MQTHTLERLTGPASALWLAVFVIPMFLFTPDLARTRRLPLLEWRAGRPALLTTIRKLGHYRNALTYLIAFMLYNDGLAAIIAFGGVYASATFGWATMTLGIFGIIVTVFAIPGAFLGGRLDDRIGSKRTVQFAVAGVIIATLGIVGVTARRAVRVPGRAVARPAACSARRRRRSSWPSPCCWASAWARCRRPAAP